MTKKPVLVVMAAGMGSRYGGLKQIDPVGCRGEAILDYSLYDAWKAGFETAVIIIKDAIRADFMDSVGKRLEKSPMEIRYAFQEVSHLPAGYTVPPDRVKPWGTGHAVLCAKKAIDGAPFAVINADDYYGKEGFRTIFEYLSNTPDGEKYNYCMVGYRIDRTVTEHGSVARGVCEIDADGFLTEVTERLRIEKHPDGIRFTEDGEHWTQLPPDTIVSMNLWGFTPSFLEALEAQFPAFLDRALAENPLKGEYLLPKQVSLLLHSGRAQAKVLTSPDQWYGVTYAADKPLVEAAIRDMTQRGLYPDGLWK